MSGDKLAASAANPEVSTAEVRKKLRRDMPGSWVLQPPADESQEQDIISDELPFQWSGQSHATDEVQVPVCVKGISVREGCDRKRSRHA